MGLINSIGSYFETLLSGFTFGTNTTKITIKDDLTVEFVNSSGSTVYEYTFPLKNGTVAMLDDVVSGPQGRQGPTGPQGVQGPQGNQGPTGPQGTQGNQGPTGPQGTQGNQGPTGPQGTQGNQGPTGPQGTQGNQGPTGPQGTQGNQGPTGPQGFQGFQGRQGPTGPQGFQGFQGFQGNNGDGTGLRYNFSTTITDADPGTGIFRFNNATISGVTQIFIDELDQGSVSHVTFIDAWDDSTSTIKGYVSFDSNTNADTTYGVFQLNSITIATGYRKLNVTYLSGTLPSDAEACVIDFSRTGDLGAQGFQGRQGPTGPQGFQGDQGRQGPTGPQGTQGNQGPTGPQGTQGNQGPTGPQGTQGNQGPTGPQGTQGNQGPTGPQGTQGNQGPTGPQGTQGNQGPTGPQGFQGNQGPTGPQGFQGNVGPGSVGPGSVDRVPLFTGTTSLGNSLIYQVSSNVQIDQNIQQGYKFFVNGSVGIASSLFVDGQVYSPVTAKGNSGTAVTFDWNNSNIQTVTMTGNATFTFSNPQSGASYQIVITQDATGGRTITWPTIHWTDKTVPTLTGTLSSKDIVTLTYDGTNYNGTISKNHGV